MGFVLEDGTGVADANAYTSVAVYRGYHTDRGRDVSAQTDEQIQAFIIRATDYAESQFATLYRGVRTTLTQALSFPRTGVVIDGICYSSTAVPNTFQFGICEYALRASLYLDLLPDGTLPVARTAANGTTIAATGPVISTSSKVGPIEKSVTYADPAYSGNWTMPSYPAADQMIAPYLTGGGRGGRTMRA